MHRRRGYQHDRLLEDAWAVSALSAGPQFPLKKGGGAEGAGVVLILERSSKMLTALAIAIH